MRFSSIALLLLVAESIQAEKYLRGRNEGKVRPWSTDSFGTEAAGGHYRDFPEEGRDLLDKGDYFKDKTQALENEIDNLMKEVKVRSVYKEKADNEEQQDVEDDHTAAAAEDNHEPKSKVDELKEMLDRHEFDKVSEFVKNSGVLSSEERNKGIQQAQPRNDEIQELHDGIQELHDGINDMQEQQRNDGIQELHDRINAMKEKIEARSIKNKEESGNEDEDVGDNHTATAGEEDRSHDIREFDEEEDDSQTKQEQQRNDRIQELQDRIKNLMEEEESKSINTKEESDDEDEDVEDDHNAAAEEEDRSHDIKEFDDEEEEDSQIQQEQPRNDRIQELKDRMNALKEVEARSIDNNEEKSYYEEDEDVEDHYTSRVFDNEDNNVGDGTEKYYDDINHSMFRFDKNEEEVTNDFGNVEITEENMSHFEVYEDNGESFTEEENGEYYTAKENGESFTEEENGESFIEGGNGEYYTEENGESFIEEGNGEYYTEEENDEENKFGNDRVHALKNSLSLALQEEGDKIYLLEKRNTLLRLKDSMNSLKEVMKTFPL